MMLDFGVSESIGSHQRRCCAATTTQMWSGSTTDAALWRVSTSRDCPPVSEQNCLGTVTPEASVVKQCRRLPSPPASTIAQALLLIVMNHRSDSFAFMVSTAASWALSREKECDERKFRLLV